jgi:lipopolysaccharide export system protein LptC
MKSRRRIFHKPWRHALRTWDQLSIYLPVLLMGALALGTYWLVRKSPIFSAEEAPKVAKHEVDYFMRKFTIKAFDETGQLQSEIHGVEGRHYPDSDTLEIDQPRILSLRDENRRVTSTGNRALSNGDGSEVQLMGKVRVVREVVVSTGGKVLPRMEFQGEFLHAFANEERFKSHLPVLLIRGADQFTGDTFTYDNRTGIVELKGRVKGKLGSGAPNR